MTKELKEALERELASALGLGDANRIYRALMNSSTKERTTTMTTYELCKQLVKRGKLTAAMLDVFFAAGRITDEQYRELLAEIQPAT